GTFCVSRRPHRYHQLRCYPAPIGGAVEYESHSRLVSEHRNLPRSRPVPPTRRGIDAVDNRFFGTERTLDSMTEQPQAYDNAVGARAQLTTGSGTTYLYYRLERLVELGLVDNLERLPFTVRILLENVLRNIGGEFAEQRHL